MVFTEFASAYVLPRTPMSRISPKVIFVGRSVICATIGSLIAIPVEIALQAI